MFSIVIPLYNKELSIQTTLESVLNQTFKDFEVIIVNDGSTDNSCGVVKVFNDDRIKIINKTNGGVSSARNRGIREAKHEWIAFLDGDDLWYSDHLKTLEEAIRMYNYEEVFCNSYIRSNEELSEKISNSVVVVDDYFKEAVKKQFFWTSVACIHRRVFDNVGGFNENYNRGEDLDLWTRIGRKYKFVKSNKVTAVYRLEAENRSDLQFDLNKSRIYNYNFDNVLSNSELRYYKTGLVNTLRGFIKQRSFKNFILLYKKHMNHISLLDVISFSQ